MRVFRRIAEFRAARRALTGSLGLVPTMGFLHEGHLSLVRRARRENAAAAVSIFVNPTQFGAGEDLASYPCDLDRDLAMLEEEGTALVFTPDAAEVYPEGYETTVQPGPLGERLEGASRPEHFAGVLTVVSKLFNIAQPDAAYFGQKDGQQALLIRRMARDLDFPIEVVVAPTVREPDGMAMSSRNSYLTPAERGAALCLSKGLFAAEAAWAAGERGAETLRRTAAAPIEAEPLAKPEYVSLADIATLAEIEGEARGAAMLSTAVRIGKTRLIDNVLLHSLVAPREGGHEARRTYRGAAASPMIKPRAILTPPLALPRPPTLP